MIFNVYCNHLGETTSLELKVSASTTHDEVVEKFLMFLSAVYGYDLSSEYVAVSNSTQGWTQGDLF